MSPKPWAKTEVGYMGHVKFLALNGNAISLWHEGKDYCARHCTDGIIPKGAIQMFRFRGAKSVAALTTSCGFKDEAKTKPYAPLWEAHDLGYRMHDYLDHNDCRDAVQARMERADERREADRDRLAKWRHSKQVKRVSHGVSRSVTETPDETALKRSTTEPVLETKKKRTSAPPDGDAPMGPQIGEFIALYQELFLAKSGEKPVISWGRDAKIAKSTITELGAEKAHAMLRAFFASSDQFIQSTGYGLNVFAGQLNKLLMASGAARASSQGSQKPDDRGHFPPCRSHTECRDRVLAEARAEREAAAS